VHRRSGRRGKTSPPSEARRKIAVCRLGKASCGITVDPKTIFDCQIKRIHEYKRQLLNALRIIVLYNRLQANPHLDMIPRTFFFAGKAAPAYRLAKLIIKFLNNLAGTIDGDAVTQGRLKVVFLPEYCVSLAERLIWRPMSPTRFQPSAIKPAAPAI
jgi:glucan phosphorylase